MIKAYLIIALIAVCLGLLIALVSWIILKTKDGIIWDGRTYETDADVKSFEANLDEESKIAMIHNILLFLAGFVSPFILVGLLTLFVAHNGEK